MKPAGWTPPGKAYSLGISVCCGVCVAGAVVTGAGAYGRDLSLPDAFKCAYCQANAEPPLAGDHSISSHWRELLADVDQRGIGAALNCIPRRNPAYRAAHRLLQRRYARHGRRFGAFALLNRLSFDIARRQGRLRDTDMLRQVLSVALVGDHVPLRGKTVAVIGDGLGTLTTLVLAAYPGTRVLAVNLTRMLAADVEFTRRALPGLDPQRLTPIEATQSAKLLEYRIDVAFNVCSMQEMNPPVIAEYFAHLRAAGRPLFYCCNRVQKRLPDGTVTRFADYPWARGDELLVDELCPWAQDYYSIRPPFIRPYDGPIWHRLAALGD